MATSGECYSSEYNNRGIMFAWSRVGYDSSANTTTIYWELRGSGSRSGYYTSGAFYVLAYYGGANHDIYYSDTRINLYNGTIITSGYMTIPMNNDGSGGFTVYIEAGIYTYAVNVSGRAEFTLDTIPRYANITSFSVSAIDETSVKYSYSVDAACDWAWYSTDNGSSWHNLPNNNTITGLSAGTSYNFKLRLRRTDSQLTTDSWTNSISTYDYPYINNLKDFTIGNNISCYLYNPLGRNVTIEFYGNNNTLICSATRNTNGTTSIGSTSQEIEAQYRSIPNQSSASFYAKAIYGSHVRNSSSKTYSINGNENPTFTTWSYKDINEETVALTRNNQIVIKNYSKIKGTILNEDKMIPQLYANPDYYQLTIGDVTRQSSYSDDDDVDVPINDNDALLAIDDTFTMYAVDKRGLSTPAIIDASTYKEYFDIYIGSAEVERTGNVSSETTLIMSGNIWNQNFGYVTNSIKSFKIEYKLTSQSDSAYQEVTVTGTPTLSGNIFSYNHVINGDLGASGYTVTQSFNIRITIEDELSSFTRVLTLGNGTPVVAITEQGVAINSPYDPQEGGSLQVDGKDITKPKISTDSNGWKKVQFPSYAEYFKTDLRSATIAGGSWTSNLFQVPLPIDLPTLGNNAFLTSCVRCEDGAIDVNLSAGPQSNAVTFTARNKYGSSITSNVRYHLRIIKFNE